MRGISVLSLGIWLVMALAAPAQTNGYEIKVLVPGMQQGMSKLVGSVGDRNFLADSAVVNAQGQAVYQGKTPLAGGLYYLIFPDNRNVQLLLDKDQHFTLQAQTSDLVGTMQVEGSVDNSLLYENLRFETQFQAQLRGYEDQIATQPANSESRKTLEAQRDAHIATRKAHLQGFAQNHPESFFTVFKLAGQNPDLTFPQKPNGDLDTLLQVYTYRHQYWDNTDLTDERLLHTPIIANKLKTYMSQLTDQRIDSVIKYADLVIEKSKPNKECFKFVVNWIAIQYHKSTIMGGEKIFVHLVDRYFTNELAFWSNPEELGKIRKQANEMRVSMLGMKGQDLKCLSDQGGYASLYDLKSPVVIVYIYSYDCDHCKERTPAMKQVAADWKEKGVEVYALCTNPDEAKWKQFIQQYGLQGFHNVYDPRYESRYYTKYHVDITPEVYVLNKNHEIIAKDLHPNQLKPVLEKELGSLK